MKRRVEVTLRFSLDGLVDDYDDDYESNMLSIECIESAVQAGGSKHFLDNWNNACGS